MKKLMLLMSLTTTIIFSSCSSDSNNIEVKEEFPINKDVPDELKGTWKIDIATPAKDPNVNDGNSFGAFIKFNSDNTIEYKDGNKFGGVNSINKISVKQVNYQPSSNYIGLIIDNIPTSIDCRKTSTNQGRTEFKIIYPSNSGKEDMILIGIKQ
ncbi:hypothetical protein ACVVIH_20400 [Chryseobacterium arthrosphaerae]